MEQILAPGQIFWLVIPLFSEKKWTYERPFLVYGTEDGDYIFLKISIRPKEYLEQFEFSPDNKPSSLYKDKNFVETNILIYIEQDLFPDLLNKTTRLVEQGQLILPEAFQEIKKKVKECFRDNKFRGNRYQVRVK
ncbi:protein of unknown function [endosymbiont DhMRE of Dentiscutata heterogama]|uniref:hypothetical protein n=1 Tax=endosymbiont DhMRE of Dentiscutata heterogama TaxID=1609546 RepID=UPI000629D71A|nr:hypothetical protein [endosymbiont DhMRE of Dentiscutata heterogama]CFW93348.1 protein of unknown function [endosymbiont DhMRE of Dentiscutata heterogama]